MWAREGKQMTLLSDYIPTWQEELFSGKPPLVFNCGDLAGLNLQPGRVVMVGAPPNVGKTPLAMQATFDSLHNHPELKAVVCSVEMSPKKILNRELARVSGVPLDYIMQRQIGEFGERMKKGVKTIQAIENRI